MVTLQKPVNQLLEPSKWFPHRYQIDAGNIEMIEIDRQMIETTTFLATPKFPGKQTNRQLVSVESLSQVSSQSSPPAFIFHSAFCCSTLIARAIDVPGRVRSLKEPQITMDIADYIRRNAKVPKHIKIIRNLLSRTPIAGEKTVIKPTNMANNLLLHNTGLLAKSPILFLYGSLRGFLISVLKKGEQGRFMTRRMYSIFMNDPTRFKEIPLKQLATLTDLQIAAMVWLLQTEIFEQKLLDCSDESMVSLNCDHFLAKPAEYLSSINEHFKLGLNKQELCKLATSELLHLNSKNQDKNYDSGKRKLESDKIELEYGSTIDHICQWADGLSLNGKIKHELSRPLVAKL